MAKVAASAGAVGRISNLRGGCSSAGGQNWTRNLVHVAWPSGVRFAAPEMEDGAGHMDRPSASSDSPVIPDSEIATPFARCCDLDGDSRHHAYMGHHAPVDPTLVSLAVSPESYDRVS